MALEGIPPLELRHLLADRQLHDLPYGAGSRLPEVC
jgi:hypothetical protein